MHITCSNGTNQEHVQCTFNFCLFLWPQECRQSFKCAETRYIMYTYIYIYIYAENWQKLHTDVDSSVPFSSQLWSITECLIHRGLNQVIILQTILSNTFTPQKLFAFWFIFHWCLFALVRMVQLILKSALLQVIAWCRTGAKPLPEPILTQLTDEYMHYKPPMC